MNLLAQVFLFCFRIVLTGRSVHVMKYDHFLIKLAVSGSSLY